MNEALAGVFDWVCGQSWDHTWAPGGEGLACCQRCTGLYVGAAIGLLARTLTRHRASGRWLAIHGLFLLLMVPLGLHWVPQGPVLRTASGFLFGTGVAAYLSVIPGTQWRSWGGPIRRASLVYGAGLAAGGALTFWLATSDSIWGWRALSILVSLGLAVVAGLATMNATWAVAEFWRRLHRPSVQSRAIG